MKEKKPKSPVVVFAAILFLSMFIILPPLFRTYFPKEEEVVVKDVKQHVLSCERLSIAEKLKITMKVTYEDDIPVKNTITYIAYTPTEEEIAAGDTVLADKSAAEEMKYFRSINDISFSESASQTVVVITDAVINNNQEQVELTNYLLETDVMISNFEAQGYTCTKIEL